MGLEWVPIVGNIVFVEFMEWPAVSILLRGCIIQPVADKGRRKKALMGTISNFYRPSFHILQAMVVVSVKYGGISIICKIAL